MKVLKWTLVFVVAVAELVALSIIAIAMGMPLTRGVVELLDLNPGR